MSALTSAFVGLLLSLTAIAFLPSAEADGCAFVETPCVCLIGLSTPPPCTARSGAACLASFGVVPEGSFGYVCGPYSCVTEDIVCWCTSFTTAGMCYNGVGRSSIVAVGVSDSQMVGACP